MNPQLIELLLSRWSLAASGSQQFKSTTVIDGMFQLQIDGHPATENDIIEISAIPDHAVKKASHDKTTWSWYTHADQIFGKGGKLAKAMPNYEMRPQQVQMSQVIQRGIEMGYPVVVEAGTGTGKSFAYAATALNMGKSLIIAAPTTALQMQLWRKDIPFLQTIYPGREVALLMGKSNYFCMDKVFDADQFVTNAVLHPNKPSVVADWLMGEDVTGNVQDFGGEITDEVNKLKIDDDCVCNGCPLREQCFYYKAKAKAEFADIVITNHSLLSLHNMYPNAGLLPAVDVIVIDEAHQLPDYVRNTIGTTISKKGLERLFVRIKTMIESINRKGRRIVRAELEDLNDQIGKFVTEVWDSYKGSKEEFQVTVDDSLLFTEGQELAKFLRSIAGLIWDTSKKPVGKDDKRAHKLSVTIDRTADSVMLFSLPTPLKHVRYIEIKEDKMHVVPFDVSEFLHDMIQPGEDSDLPIARNKCYGCTVELDQDVFMLNGNGFCINCIDSYDVAGDSKIMSLEDFLGTPKPEREIPQSVILTSATIAAPDMSGFRLQCGITEALELQVTSPFDYKSQMLLYIPDDKFPDPKKDQAGHQEAVADTMRKMVLSSRGGAFLLFTSSKALNYTYDSLNKIFKDAGLLVLKQGDFSKTEIITRFKQAGNAVLFGTKTFWEGVDVAGDALRLIAIDKLPFEAPNPITEAMGKHLKKYARETLGYEGDRAEWYPFDKMLLPNMIIDLKQGVGRLIRTSHDMGACVILDPRIRSTRYGREQVLKSLPAGLLTAKVEMVDMFFRNLRSEDRYRVAA